MKTTVSIIIPTYNRAQYLEKAVKSVLAQTFRDFELIVIDDGSTDDTRKVVNLYLSDPRVRYIYQENKERGAARNNGIRNAIGKYIALLDSDDLWLAGHLEVCLKRVESIDKTALIFSNSLIMDENDKVISKLYTKVHEGHVMERMVKRLAGDFAPSACLIPRVIFDDIGFFVEKKCFSAEDTEMWIRISNKYPFFSTHKFTVLYRTHSQNSINDAVNAEKNLRELIELLLSNKALPVDYIKRLLYTWQYTTFAEIYCHFGNMKEARSYLCKAIKRDKKQLFEPRWWWILSKSIAGKTLIEKLKGIAVL